MQIHELNTFAGTPGAGNFLAIDNGSDTGKISGEALLKGPNDRIDNLITNVLPDSVVTLYSDDSGVSGTVTLSDDVSNYDFLDLYFKDFQTGNHRGGVRVPVSQFPADISIPTQDANFNGYIYIGRCRVTVSGNTLTTAARLWEWNGDADSDAFITSGAWVTMLVRVDGVKISSNTSAELTDIRTGAAALGGIIYTSAGQAVRSQVTALYNLITDFEHREPLNIAYQVNYNIDHFDGKLTHTFISASTGQDGGTSNQYASTPNYIACANKETITLINTHDTPAGRLFVLYYSDNAFLGYTARQNGVPEKTTFDILENTTRIRFEYIWDSDIDLEVVKDQIFVYFDYETTSREYINDLNYYTPLHYPLDLDFVYPRIFTIVTKDWYYATSGGSAVISADNIVDLHIVKGYTHANIPIVAYFSGQPSPSTYLGNTGAPASGYATIEDVDCVIPSNCTHIVIQGLYNTPADAPIVTAKTRIQDYAAQIDKKINALGTQINKRIAYQLNGTDLAMSSYYGTESLEISFGRRGVNALPDFKNIKAGDRNLYAGYTDWFAPYIVAALNNADGDDVSHHYFTGGNHNYNNTGDTNYSATGRNISLEYFADGRLLADGDSGTCDEIRIEFTSRIQAYNTRKADGSGREVLEEKHVLFYDGLSMRCETYILPLEDISIETWYGYQANVSSWPTIEFVGGINRKAAALSTHPLSGNSLPNEMRCYSATDLLEIEIDRTFDLGKGECYSGNMGMFASGNKVYCYIAQNKEMSEGDYYWLRGWYRFIPN